MLAICNEGCNKQFEVKEFKERKLKGGVREIYFKCTHCNKKYICFYTDREIRKLQTDLRNKRSNTKREEIEQLQQRIKEKMDKLKVEMLGT